VWEFAAERVPGCGVGLVKTIQGIGLGREPENLQQSGGSREAPARVGRALLGGVWVSPPL